MTVTFLLCFALFVQEFLASPSATTVQPCPPNEVFKPCGTVCEPSCINPFPDVCQAICKLNVCQCAPNFFRSFSGKCVSLDQCEYMITCDDVSCPCGHCVQDPGCPKPPPKCSDGSDVTCNNVKCKSGYHCVQHTIFCIKAPCPQPAPYCEKDPVCGENEEFLVCGKKCEPKCGEPVVTPCVDDGRCVPNVCQCKQNYLRNVMNKKCILQKYCPPVRG